MVVARNRGDQFFVDGIGFPGLPSTLPSSVILGAEAQGNIIISLSPTGSDSDATRPARIVTGDWSAKPFLTLQGAVNSLSRLGRTNIDIVVAPGTYIDDTFFSGFLVPPGPAPSLPVGYLIKVYPTPGQEWESWVPTTGLSTFPTFTSTGLGWGEVTGAGWTPHDLAGKILSPAGLQIIDNTADRIWCNTNTDLGSLTGPFSFQRHAVRLGLVQVAGCTSYVQFGDLHLGTYRVNRSARAVLSGKCNVGGLSMLHVQHVQLGLVTVQGGISLDEIARTYADRLGLGNAAFLNANNCGVVELQGIHLYGGANLEFVDVLHANFVAGWFDQTTADSVVKATNSLIDVGAQVTSLLTDPGAGNGTIFLLNNSKLFIANGTHVFDNSGGNYVFDLSRASRVTFAGDLDLSAGTADFRMVEYSQLIPYSDVTNTGDAVADAAGNFVMHEA